MTTVVERMEKMIWGEYSEPKAKDFFLINSSWALFALIACHWFFVAKIGPYIMKNRKPLNLGPLMIVLNGLQFGAYGCGIMLIGYGINFGWDAWRCHQSPSNDSFRDEVFLRIAYVLFCMRLLESTTPIIMVLRKKHDQHPLLHAVYNGVYLTIIYHCINRYYKEVVYMYPYTDAMKIALRSAYYSLTLPGPPFQRHAGRKRYITAISLAIVLYNVYHMVSMIQGSCDGPKAILLAFATLSSAESVYYGWKLLNSGKSKVSAKSM